MAIRPKVLEALTQHWHSHCDGGIPVCNCGTYADDINVHIACKVMTAISPSLQDGADFTVRWQYGEQLLNKTMIVPLPDEHTGGPTIATHRRKIIIARDWEPM